MVLSRRIWPPRAGRPPCPSANALRKRTVHRFLVEGRCTLDRGAPDHRPAHVRYRKPLPHRALEGRGLWPQRALHRCDRSCRHVAQRRAQHGGHKVQGGLRSHRMGHAQGQHLLHVDSHDLRGSPTAPDTCLPSLHALCTLQRVRVILAAEGVAKVGEAEQCVPPCVRVGHVSQNQLYYTTCSCIGIRTAQSPTAPSADLSTITQSRLSLTDCDSSVRRVNSHRARAANAHGKLVRSSAARARAPAIHNLL